MAITEDRPLALEAGAVTKVAARPPRCTYKAPE